MVRGAAIGIVMALALAIAAGRAEAQSVEAAAEGLFQDAVALRKEGKWKQACEKFEASHKLAPARGTLLNIAECHEHFGELAQAWATYRKLAEVSKLAGDAERLGIARARIQVLEPQLPRIVIQLSPGAQIDGLDVQLDGAPVDASLRGAGVPVDSGVHTITATAPGYFGWSATVTIGAQASETVEIPPLVSMDAERRRIRRRTIYAGIFAGAGVAALAVSGAFGLRASGQWSDANSECADDGTCSAAGLALIDDAKASARVADIAGGVGLAALVTGVVLWLTRPSLAERAPATAVVPTLGATGVGVALTGSF